ncbi:MAG: RraA family protein [Beijerinckiaceae bacterium]
MPPRLQGPLPQDLLTKLAAYDTPTICNALEIVAPERRLKGFTHRSLFCLHPNAPPTVGYARTATIRGTAASDLPEQEQREKRFAYYAYVASGHGPRISLIQDLDGPNAGFGAFWGEVHSAVHKALGCIGVVTDGSIRDLPQFAEGFQALAGMVAPSHAHNHLCDFAQHVRVAGMDVSSDDLIHADQHGAVVIPRNVAAKVPEAAELCMRREAPILAACRSKDFSLEALRAAIMKSGEIH